jgi:DNA end-binding protein Ku
MARPVWTGTISFGLVAIPVKMFHAVRKQSVSFNQLDERNMARIRYRKVNAETGEEVADEHIVKGFEVAKGRYVVVDPDELEPFIPAATKSVDLEEFVDLSEIDPVYFDTAYHLAPNGSPKPYALLARAMEASGKVAIGRFVMRNKQYTAAIRAEDGRLVMSSLAYADEVIDPSEIEELQGIDDVEVTRKEMAMAESLVASLSADFEPDKYHDEYREQVMALIRRKADGEEFEAPEAPTEKPNVIDIMAALEASVAAAKEARSRHPAKKAAAGKKPSEAAKKAPAQKSTRKAPAKKSAEKSAQKSSARKSA